MMFNEAIEDVTGERQMIAMGEVTPEALVAYLAKHAPQLALAVATETLAKEQPGVGDVHQATALGNAGGGRRKAKTFLTTIAELKGGARVVTVPDRVGDADVGESQDGLAAKRVQDLASTILAADDAAKQAPPPGLKPIDEARSHSPFPHDANALGNLRPDQVPRFLGALTDQDSLPIRRVRMNGLVAMQDRVDHGKVYEMQDGPPDKPALVVRNDGRNLIADGHHRLAALLLSGARSAEVRFLDLSPEDAAVKAEDGDEVDFEAVIEIAKLDADQQKVFGWASITHIAGELVVDKQDDIIEPEDLEKAAHDFVLHSREQGDMHTKRHVGRLIGSVVFTPEKFDKCGLYAFDPETREQLYGWWVEFQTSDADTWAAIKSGDLPEFSISGRAIRVPVDGAGDGAAGRAAQPG